MAPLLHRAAIKNHCNTYWSIDKYYNKYCKLQY